MFSVRFHFLLWILVTAQDETLYRKIGDTVVLTPVSKGGPITSIEWKHGPDIAMEWYGDETVPYRHFKERGSLNIKNGALTIRKLTPSDRGIYTVEINNKLNSKIELRVISAVPKPTLLIVCEMTSCVLTCDGDTRGAEPVTYWWTSPDKTWSSTKEIKITLDKVQRFSCAVENPVSKFKSETVSIPLRSNRIFMAFLVLCIIIIIIIIIIIKWRKQLIEMLPLKSSREPEMELM